MSETNTPPTNYTTTNLIILCIVGFVIKFFFSQPASENGETGPASSTIWGYGIAAIAVFFLTFINFALLNKGDNDYKGKTAKFAGSFITGTLPSIFTLILLIYMIWLNFQYFTKINSGKVADDFYNMSKMSNVLLVFQILTLFKYMRTIKKSSENLSVYGTNDSTIIYLLTILNIVFIIILNIILEFFSTDG